MKQFHRSFSVRKKADETEKELLFRCKKKQDDIIKKMRFYSKHDWMFTVKETEKAVIYSVYLTAKDTLNTRYGRWASREGEPC